MRTIDFLQSTQFSKEMLQQMILEQLNIYMQKNELGSMALTTYKKFTLHLS